MGRLGPGHPRDTAAQELGHQVPALRLLYLPQVRAVRVRHPLSSLAEEARAEGARQGR